MTTDAGDEACSFAGLNRGSRATEPDPSDAHAWSNPHPTMFLSIQTLATRTTKRKADWSLRRVLSSCRADKQNADVLPPDDDLTE